MSGTYYAGDVGAELLLGPLATGDVDGTTIDSARVVAVPPQNGAPIELAVTIASQSTGAITLRHVTDGDVAASGTWRLRAWYYDGATLIASSLEFDWPVAARRVPLPT